MFEFFDDVVIWKELLYAFKGRDEDGQEYWRNQKFIRDLKSPN